MIKFFNSLNIGLKIIITVICTILFLVLILDAFILINEQSIIKHSILNNTQFIAQTLSDRIAPLIVESNYSEIFKITNLIRKKDSLILDISIYEITNNGLVLIYSNNNKIQIGEKINLKLMEKSKFYKDYFFISTPIKINNQIIGFLTISYSLKQMQEKIYKTQKIILSLTILSLLFAFIISYLTTKLITNPINNFVNTIYDISSNNLNKRVDVKSKDEIGILAESFNKMLDSIKIYENISSFSNLQIEPDIVVNLIIDDLKKYLKTENIILGSYDSEKFIIVKELYSINREEKGLIINNCNQLISKQHNDKSFSKEKTYYLNLLFSEEVVTGFICFIFKKTKNLTKQDINILNSISKNISSIFTKSKYRIKSITDELTQIYNRAFFEENFSKYINYVNMKKGFFSLIIFDLDDFKIVNDTFGHQAGDEVLIFFANILKAESRKNDIICRIGGEEFAVLMPDTYIDGAVKYLKRVYFSLANKDLLYDNTVIKIKTSAGAAEFIKEYISKNEAFDIVDKKLYKAKKQGKNQFVV